MQQSNSLEAQFNVVADGMDITVNLRLNDKCKNGHQDFAITADIYEAGKRKTDRNMIMCGCCHAEIAKYMPELIPFIKLHLCDYTGTPMYAVANGYYHLRNGFNRTKTDNPAFKAEFCEYYRITSKQFEVLNTAQSKVHYYMLLVELGIPAQWKTQADAAIQALEEITETKFVIDSRRTQMDAPTVEEIENEKKLLTSGYYSDAAKAERRKAKIDAEIAKATAEADKAKNDIDTELNIKKQLLTICTEDEDSQIIYYNHNKTIAFNWRTHSNPIPADRVEAIKAAIVLPDGVSFA